MTFLLAILIIVLLFGGLGAPQFGWGAYNVPQTGGTLLIAVILVVLLMRGGL